MFFNSNIKHLRQQRKKTQDEVARALGISRSTLNSYENGSVQNPTLEALVRFSRYYKISIDTLVKTDLTQLSAFQLAELLKGHDVYISGSRLRVLATTVDSSNKENIEVVPLKAKAGYRRGFADPEFIRQLPAFQLPILLSDRKYRMFQIEGDSMLPIKDKSWIIGEFVEDWYSIKNGTACVLLLREEGIVFKVVYNELKRHRRLLLQSLNPAYATYSVDAAEVQEVWKFCYYISNDMPEAQHWHASLLSTLERIEQDIQMAKNALVEHEQHTRPHPRQSE